MSSASPTQDAPPTVPNPGPLQTERHNLAVLALQNIVLRVGWIFKTESVIMPAFLDVIAGAGWLRGCLPILSRTGQSVPPLLFADRLRRAPLKKRMLAMTALQMAWPFLLLSFLWNRLEDRQQPWLPAVFLVLYFLFFCATGLNQLAYGTLQGKLIRPQRRGFLLGVGGIFGSVAAVTAALVYLRPWLALPDYDGFTYVFLFNGAAFLFAGIVAQFCREEPDVPREGPVSRMSNSFHNAWAVFRDDRAFRRAAAVAMLFTSSMLLMPHYQWVGREKIQAPAEDLILWVIAQNISVGVLSPLLGVVADRFGNRLAIRMAVFGMSTTPLVALAFAEMPLEVGQRWYWVTFVFLGLLPVTMKALLNYALELVSQDDHPRYQSTMALCFALPFLFSPLVGATIDWLPFAYPFLMVSGLVFLGGVLTFRMDEPRNWTPDELAAAGHSSQ